ncbi:MAG: IS4 family transposase [Thiohalocapsa sp.]
MVRMVAGVGGFLNRKHNGFAGSQSIWIGLQRPAGFCSRRRLARLPTGRVTGNDV